MKKPGSLEPKLLRALNRRLLASQCLSRRARGRGSVVAAAEACCGVNSQDYLESFTSFWARVDGFADSELLSELRPGGGLVRTWTVRNTMHTIPSKDYWVHVLGGPGRRFPPLYDKRAKERGIPGREFRLRSLYEPLLDHIKGRAATTSEVKEFVVERLARNGLRSRMKLQRGWSNQATIGPSWSGLSEMCGMGLLVTAGRRGSEGLWMRTSDWLLSGRRVPDSDECVIGLVRRYIERYCPVSRDDIVYWTLLLTSDVDMALDALKGELTTDAYASDRTLFSIGGRADGPEPDEAMLLPEFDSLMMGYKDKSRVLAPDQVKKVFWGFGGIKRTVLLDGFVAATWERKAKGDLMSIQTRPFRPLTAYERRSLDDVFARFGEYKGLKVSLKFTGP